MRRKPLVPNRALSKLIAEAECSYDALAAAVRAVGRDSSARTTKATVAHWVAGHQPGTKTVGYLVEALSRKVGRQLSPGDLGLASDEDVLPTHDPVAALASLGRADVDRRAVLTGTVYSIAALLLPLDQAAEQVARASRAARGRARVGANEVKAVKEMAIAFTRADETLGGGHARSAVAEYLASDVPAYLDGRFASDTIRKEMFGAAAQVAYLAGWKAHDVGQSGLAQQYYLRAHSLAQVADPYAHTAYTLRILAHQAMDLGLSQHCTDLADEALRLVTGRVNPAVESLFHLTQARAYATDRMPGKAVTALQTAEALIGKVQVEQSPDWAALGGPAEARLAHQAGKTLQLCRDFPAAQKQLTLAAGAWNPDTHPRVYALTMADLAETQCQRGHLDKACGTWDKALDKMSGMRSARTNDALRSLRAHLSPHLRSGAPAARRLDARAARMLRQAG